MTWARPFSGPKRHNAALAGGRPVNPLDAGGPARAISLPRAGHIVDSPRLRSECFLAGASPRSSLTYCPRRCGLRMRARGRCLERPPGLCCTSELAVASSAKRVGPSAPRYFMSSVLARVLIDLKERISEVHASPWRSHFPKLDPEVRPRNPTAGESARWSCLDRQSGGAQRKSQEEGKVRCFRRYGISIKRAVGPCGSSCSGSSARSP